MRWFLIILALVSFRANAVPDEILVGYLNRHELCVKDARIRANSQEEFKELKTMCKIEYLEKVGGSIDSDRDISIKSSQRKDWLNFIESTKSLPEFRIDSKRVYLKRVNRATLGGYYFSRKHGRLILWKDGMQIDNYSAIPIRDALRNSRFENDRIIISGMDADVLYYAYKDGRVYRFETEFGSTLSANAALFLASSAVIIYNDVPIGIITRNVAKETD